MKVTIQTVAGVKHTLEGVNPESTVAEVKVILFATKTKNNKITSFPLPGSGRKESQFRRSRPNETNLCWQASQGSTDNGRCEGRRFSHPNLKLIGLGKRWRFYGGNGHE